MAIAMAVALVARRRSTPSRKYVGADGGRRERFRRGFLIDTFRVLLVLLDRIHSQILFLDLRQVVAIEIGHGQLPEDVIDDRRGHLDPVVQLDRPVRLEAGKDKGFDELLQRHAMLKPERDGDGEAVHEAAEGGPFLMHVQEDFAAGTVLVFTRAEIELMPPDDGFLRIPIASARERPAFRQVPHQHSLCDFFRHRQHFRRGFNRLAAVRRGG